jgi:Alpha-L-arabinofuranosidase B (ABFB) domain
MPSTGLRRQSARSASNPLLDGSDGPACSSHGAQDCLRHRNFRILDSAYAGDALFETGSSFWLVRGWPANTPGTPEENFSFRSVNFPDRYLRHRDFHLWVEAPSGQDDTLFREGATCTGHLASVRID